MKLFTTLLVLAATAAIPAPGYAQNTLFLRKSPIAHMSESDQAILHQTILAIVEAPDGTITDWLNPETGSKGRLQVLDTHQDYGTTCRRIRGRNEVDGRSGGGDYRLCLSEDGNWRFAPISDSAPAEPESD